MKLLNLFQALPMTIAAVASQFSPSLAVEAAAWQADQEDRQLEEWVEMHNGRVGKSLMKEQAQKTYTYLRTRALEEQQRLRMAASVVDTKSTMRDESRPLVDHPYRTRQLKDKTGSIFDPPATTSESLSSTKAPKISCKSTKSPSKAAKSTKGPIASFVFCDSDGISEAPSYLPSSTPSNSIGPSSLPSMSPSESTAPSDSPSESMAPSVQPSESLQPSTQPSLSVNPSLQPSESAAPSTSPSESMAPSAQPSESLQPSMQPSQSMSPSLQPSESAQPSFLPSSSSQPSLQPTLSLAPSIQPSESNVPSSQPSGYVFPGCLPVKDPPAPNQCFTGNGTEVTDSCAQASAGCCTPVGACNFGNATICSGSCNGDSACYGIGNDTFIDQGSCNGFKACFDLGKSATSVQVDAGSCNCGYSCRRVDANGAVLIESNSCRGLESCDRAGGAFVDSVMIGFNSCNPYNACIFAGGNAETFIVGDNSCNGDSACYDFAAFGRRAVSIGTGSCNGEESCRGIGYGAATGGVIDVSVGDNSCNPMEACLRFGYNVGGGANVSVGNSACNSSVSQCSGGPCDDGSGPNGLMIPDGGTSC